MAGITFTCRWCWRRLGNVLDLTPGLQTPGQNFNHPYDLPSDDITSRTRKKSCLSCSGGLPPEVRRGEDVRACGRQWWEDPLATFKSQFPPPLGSADILVGTSLSEAKITSTSTASSRPHTPSSPGPGLFKAVRRYANQGLGEPTVGSGGPKNAELA